MTFLAFCVRHAVPVIVAVLLAILFGVLAVVQIPRQLTPTVDVPVIGVAVRYLGAGPQEIEKEIVDKLEEQLNAVEGVREMTSQSQDGGCSIRLEFDWGTDLGVASIDVTNKLNLVPELPDEADEPTIFFGEEFGYPICFISLKGEGKTSDDLREFAEDVLEPYLKRVLGVSRVDVYGGRERQVEATFDPYTLASYQLTPMEVAQALAQANRNTRGGRIDELKNRWVVRTVGEFRTADDVEQVVLRRPGMPDVRMDELLEVSRQKFKDAEAYVRIDAAQGIVFAVHKKTGQNVVAIMQEVYQTVGYLNENILDRQAMRMEVVYDESEYIKRSIGQLNENVFICAALAGAVLVLFLRNPSAILTVFVTIPISFISTFIVLWALGRTLNVVSLAGLAFAVGLLVDNAIVVLENIYRHREMGKGPMQAALDGGREVWAAVAASTLTTVAVFVPILLIQEEAGQLFRDIAYAIAISVSLSLVVSMTVIPMLTARILRTRHGAGDASAQARGVWYWATFQWFGGWFKRRLTGLVAWILARPARRAVTALGILGVFGAALVGFLGITQPTYLPTGNRNFVIGFVLTEAGASLDHNLAVAKEIERRVYDVEAQVPASERMERFFAVALPGRVFFGARSADADKARAMADRVQAAVGSAPPPFLPGFMLEDWFRRNGRFLKEPIAGITVFAEQVGLFQRQGTIGGQTISVTVRGDDIQRLYAIAGRIQQRLAETTGVQFVNPSYKLGNWELRPTPDGKRCADVGLTKADVGYFVGALVNGVKVADFREEGGNELDLTLRGKPDFRRHIEAIGDVPLWTPRGGTVTLSQVASILPEEGYDVIQHTQQQRSVELETAIEPDVPIGQVVEAVRHDILEPMYADGTIPAEYVVDLRGTAQDLARMWRALQWSLVLALVIVYLLMAALFESFAYPFVIMLSVPLAVVGGFMMFWTMFFYNLWLGIPPPQLDVVTMLGFVILIGIVVNNAILVVAQALNYHRNEGLEIKRAIVMSVESRIRPIFMSTMTSVLAMMPLVLRPGPGSELYQGLGAVVVGGLLISTVFTLILTPVVFSFGFGATERLHALARRWGLIVVDAGDAP